LFFPLATALLLGQPGLTAWALCALAIGGFLAHEGFVVLAGGRGDRARRDDGVRARHSLLSFGAIALAGSVTAALRLDVTLAWGAGVAILLSGAAVLTAWLGREHSLPGELFAALALTSWCLPVALAGGLQVHSATGLWLIWFAVFGMATTAVQSVIARSTRRSPTIANTLCALIAALALGSVLSATQSGWLPVGVAWTLLPAGIASFVLVARPVPARQLRSIGWSIIAVSVVTLATMLWAFGPVPPLPLEGVAGVHAPALESAAEPLHALRG